MSVSQPWLPFIIEAPEGEICQNIPTIENVETDFLSRHQLTTWELELNQEMFHQITRYFKVNLTLDAFASRLAHKLPRYLTWEPDSQALGRDLMLYEWDHLTYVFPPDSPNSKNPSQSRDGESEGILVCPYWPTSL